MDLSNIKSNLINLINDITEPEILNLDDEKIEKKLFIKPDIENQLINEFSSLTLNNKLNKTPIW